MQKYTSKDTSISSVNRFYKILTEADPNFHNVIFDYGCGKYDNNKRTAEAKGYEWFGYDPYNRTAEYNTQSMQMLKHCGEPKYICCNNVLNVIAEDEYILDIISNILNLMGSDTQAVFTIYEGDRSGIGKPTRKGYQRNQKTKDYINILRLFFVIENVKGNMIIARI